MHAATAIYFVFGSRHSSRRRLGVDLADRERLDHPAHAFLRRVAVDALGARRGLRQTPLAAVVQVPEPDEVVERLHALHLLAEETPADNLGKVVVAPALHVVVRGEVRVDEAQRRVPDTARNAHAPFVGKHVPDPGRLRAAPPAVRRGRHVRAHKTRHSHLAQRVFMKQHVRVSQRAGQARQPVALAIFEPLSRNVVALLTPHHHHVEFAELGRAYTVIVIRNVRRRRLRVELLVCFFESLFGFSGALRRRFRRAL
mmetsp:Transcript_11164/g.47639  ORF Transcript_11164/g.47639 Transcript_11164/m.47639 type:complete len:256 (+) Transcript_11164:3838-4605(+)